MMTVICFLDDIMTVFHEVSRVLKPGGMLIVGFIEKDGKIQREFLHESTKGRFLRYAKFMAVSEVAGIFSDAEFAGVSVIKRTRGFCVMKGQKKVGEDDLLSQHSRIESVARADISTHITGIKPFHPLRGRAVREGIGHYIAL
jgi:SAM-dependent methyltransferase